MNQSLVPANAKKSLLILGMFRLTPDIPILGVGIGITIFLLMIVGNMGFWLLILACIPMAISVILVLPLPHYHNTLCAIQSLLSFYNNRRNYIWRGWCMKNEFGKQK